MNCKQIQELLPLYVGRDLEEKRARLVTAHLQSCADCAGSADEYRETQQLLQQFEPPPFSEAVYTGIRRHVLREIERESSAPTLPPVIASLFRPRMRWAVATSLLLAVSVLAIYLIANRTNDRWQVAGGRDTETKGNQPVLSPSPSSKGGHSPSPGTKNGLNAGRHTTIAVSEDPIGPSQRRKSRETAGDRTKSLAVNTPDSRAITVEGSTKVNDQIEPDAVWARNSPSSGKTLRLEMRTKDPNVRIIWFSDQRTKQNSPSESSKGI